MQKSIHTKTDFTATESRPRIWPIALCFTFMAFAFLGELDILRRLDHLAMWMSQLSLKLSLLFFYIFGILFQALLAFFIAKLIYVEVKKRNRGG